VVKCSDLDQQLSAISDPTRRRILERLAAGPASISELGEPLEISMPGLLKHVRVLEAAELVRTHKHGRTRHCELGDASLDDVAAWVDAQRDRWNHRLDRLEAYLTTKEGT
jgi:DNA-binding transcriptional ArsR family regulator